MTENALHSSESSEWFTPPEDIEFARTVMGSIDLDPASCALANQIVKATKFYDGSELCADGLIAGWHGMNVFWNSPYTKKGGGPAELWVRKAIEEHAALHYVRSIGLLNATPDRAWFRSLWDFDICFKKERSDFLVSLADWQRANAKRKKPQKQPQEIAPGLVRAGSPTHGNVFVYMGSDDEARERFLQLGSKLGTVIPRGSYWK
jgi:hypothetical protein